VATWPDSGLGAAPVIGVNAIGHGDASAVAVMCANVTLPLLQDVDSVNLWTKAGAQKDDVFILDSRRNIVRTFSCYDYGLNGPGADSLRKWVREVMEGAFATKGENLTDGQIIAPRSLRCARGERTACRDPRAS
jgi:hypothetical protein